MERDFNHENASVSGNKQAPWVTKAIVRIFPTL
jgi:hypothetical protein